MITGVAMRSYLIDGTNLVRVCCGYAGPAFQAQEDADAERLVAALARAGQAFEGRAEIEVFFDGPPASWAAKASRAANLRVRFVEGEPADAVIVDRVRSRRWSGEGATVVTADAQLGEQAVAEGGRWLKVRPGWTLEGAVRAIEEPFLR